MQMKKNKKIAVASILVLSLVFPFSTWAYVVGNFPYIGEVRINVNEILQEANFSSVSQITKDAVKENEERYGINKDILRTAKRKVDAPRMEIFFDNTNPKSGEKVTAHAVPEFFKNDPQNLYYTWYIVHTTDGSIETATNSIESGKKQAAAIMARGDYDPELDGQTYPDSEKNDDLDSDGWPAIDNSYDKNKTAAPMGGADGVGGLTEETVSDFNSADEWCESLGDHSSSQCSFNDDSSLKPLNTYFTLKSGQGNHYCNLCEGYFSGAGLTDYTNAKEARNNCCYTATPESALQCSDTTEVTDPETGEVTEETTYFKCSYASGTDYCGTTYNSLFDSCYESFKTANKNTIGNCLSTEYGSCTTSWCNVHELELDPAGNCKGIFSEYSEEATVGVSRCYKHNFGTNVGASLFRENELSGESGEEDITTDPSGLDYPEACKHKWENAESPRCTANDCKSGSGKFPTGEEAYWKTDPTDPDTDGDGFTDEADVIGLGQQDFTWTYKTGDRVGVVAEGTSMIPTDEKSAYYKIMWGYPDVCDSSKRKLMDNDGCDKSDGSDDGYGFFATKAPNEAGDEKLKVSLSYSPDNPIADPSDENSGNISDDGLISDADKITVMSSLDNTTLNPSTLYYTWQIQKGTIGDEDSWEEPTPLTDYFDATTNSNGLGISSFSFTPKVDALEEDTDIVSFKVTLTVSKSSGTETGKGRSSVIIPVNKKGIKLKLYRVDVESGKATIGDGDENEICEDGLYKTLCPVVKSQLLAAKVSSSSYTSSNSDFSWSINGETYPVPTGFSDSFDGWSDTKIYFPITQSEQDTPSITVTATPKDSLQPVTATRLLTVVTPTAFINSSDKSSSWTKLYIDAEGQVRESPGFFEALFETEVLYSIDFVPDYLLGSDSNTTIDWQINGTSIDSDDFSEYDLEIADVTTENNTQTIKFTPRSTEGTSYTLGVVVKKTWSTDEKDLLYSTWGITPKNLSDDSSASLEIVSPAIEGEDAVSAKTTGQILAAIGTHLPHYFMYLLRLVLTLAVMFVLSAGFYSVSQKLTFVDEEK